VAGRAPQVSIVSPADDARVAPGEVVTLLGNAYDPETGILGGAALVWESDRDGQLGTGGMLVIAAHELSPGPHLITLRATDPTGLTGSTSVHLDLQQRIFLPAVWRR
jgi:hypothetical protein